MDKLILHVGIALVPKAPDSLHCGAVYHAIFDLSEDVNDENLAMQQLRPTHCC